MKDVKKLFVNSYFYNNKISKDKYCQNNDLIESKCYDYVFNNLKCSQKKVSNKLKMIKDIYSSVELFNADILHNFIYTVIILKKYNNLFIPTQKYFKDKAVSEKNLIYDNSLQFTPNQVTLTNILKIYYDYFYEIAPYLILWESENLNFINNDLKIYLMRAINSKKIRFILIKLTIIIGPSVTHSNIILYDKQNHILERFEPYGDVGYLSSDKLDKFLLLKFSKIFGPFKYIIPKNIKGVGFQTISNETDKTLKKINDPNGFCLAWSFWYIEQRLSNPEENPNELMDKINNDLVVNVDSTSNDEENPYLNLIRTYANNLYTEKNRYLESLGITPQKYNLQTYDKNILQLILGSLKKDLETLTSNL